MGPSIASAEHPVTDTDRADALPCVMLLWVTPLGLVQAAQVVQSAGTPGLDSLCLNSVITRQIRPRGRDGSPASGWVMFTFRMMMGLPHKEAQAALQSPKKPIPSLAHDRPLDLNQFLHEATNSTRPATVCAIHAVISPEGNINDLRLTRSTGSPPLDSACLEVIRACNFMPARLDDQPVLGQTDIWLNWQSAN
jgi:TonB family protein